MEKKELRRRSLQGSGEEGAKTKTKQERREEVKKREHEQQERQSHRGRRKRTRRGIFAQSGRSTKRPGTRKNSTDFFMAYL